MQDTGKAQQQQQLAQPVPPALPLLTQHAGGTPAVDAAASAGTAAGAGGDASSAASTPAATLAGTVGRLRDNAAAIADAEAALQRLLGARASLVAQQRQLEQRCVTDVLRRPLGFHQGRPVAALLLYRCLHHWGLLHAAAAAPGAARDGASVLQQLGEVMQQQLDLEDESAPAEVAGLQCHVAYWLSVSAVLLCLLLKTRDPQLAAGRQAQHSMAAEVVGAARRRVGELQRQITQHVAPAAMGGLQALGRRAFGGWAGGGGGAAKQAAAAAAAETTAAAATAAAGDVPDGAVDDDAAVTAGAVAVSGDSASSAGHPLPSSTAPAAPAAAELDAFVQCLDGLVQRCFTLLRDQLKRRLVPLLADCMLQPDAASRQGSSSGSALLLDEQQQQQQEEEAAVAAATAGNASSPQPGSPPPAAGVVVAGAAAACAVSAEAALLHFRVWAEIVGVLHAALVALRAAGVPRDLRAALVQQVLTLVNCQLMNQLLLRPECCSASNARYALRGLKMLDSWILAEQHSSSAAASNSTQQHSAWLSAAGAGSSSTGQQQQQQQQQLPTPTAAAAAAAAAEAAAAEPAGDEDAGWEQVWPADVGSLDEWRPAQQQQQQQQRRQLRQRRAQQQGDGEPDGHEMGPEAWNALGHVRQALQFLVLQHKGACSLDDLRHICPSLGHQQLYRLCTTAWRDDDDDDGAGEDAIVSGEVLEEMKRQHTLTTNGGLIVTFLLDEPAQLPFVEPAPAAAGAAGAAAGSGDGAAAKTAAHCRPAVAASWDDHRDYAAGMPVPAALLQADGSGGGEAAAEAWSFLQGRMALPWQ